MKKRTLFGLLFTVMTFACATGFAACAHDSDEHNLTHVAAADATCTENGNTEYWVCSDCGKYFSDAEATAEISQSDTVIAATGHTFSEDWSSDEFYHWHACLNCGEVSDKEEHTWESDVCTVCEIPRPSSRLAYTLNDDQTAYSVTGIGLCIDTDVVIPSGHDGLPVTSVGEHAFEGCRSFKSIAIPDSVTSIGEGAFYGCESLKSIIIPGSVTSIGKNAFYGCKSLKSVIIPDSVTSIEEGTFNECASLTSITIPDSVASVGERAFYGCSSLEFNEYDGVCYLGNANNPYLVLVKVKYTFVTSVAIHEDTKFICEGAFKDCRSLTSITIPDGVTSIGSYAFYYCFLITDIEIPDGVTSIGESAFYNCTSLTDIIIPGSVISIGEDAFRYCTSLESVSMRNGVTSIGENAFYGCISLTCITLPGSITSIGENAFKNCCKLAEIYNLSSMDIIKGSDSNGYVAYYALNVYTENSGQSYLETTDDGYIFYEDGEAVYLMGYAGTQTELVLPDQFNGKDYQIYNYAFSNRSSLKSVVIPDSVTSIGDYAFRYCTSLTSINIPDGVTSIGDYVFESCRSFTSIDIPDGVT